MSDKWDLPEGQTQYNPADLHKHSPEHHQKPEISVTEGDTVHYVDSNGEKHAAIVKTVHDKHTGLVGLHILHKTKPHHDIGTVVHSADPKAFHVWHHKHEG